MILVQLAIPWTRKKPDRPLKSRPEQDHQSESSGGFSQQPQGCVDRETNRRTCIPPDRWAGSSKVASFFWMTLLLRRFEKDIWKVRSS